MTLRKKGIQTLVLTCAFAMFGVAAIPTHAKAFSYYNGANSSICAEVYCDNDYSYGYGGYGGSYYGNDMYYGNVNTYPSTYYYTQPTYYTYTYPVIVNYRQPRRVEPDYFYRDWKQAANEWDGWAQHWAR